MEEDLEVLDREGLTHWFMVWTTETNGLEQELEGWDFGIVDLIECCFQIIPYVIQSCICL